MKQIWKQMLFAAVMGFVVPWICLGIAVGIGSRVSEKEPAGLDPEVTTEPPQLAAEAEENVEISVLVGDEVQPMGLEDYIACVVLAEMPAEFEPEALKAQAVVARTYALRRMETGTKHETSDICADPNCCQGYRSTTEYLQRGGSAESVEKIVTAVRETAGQVLTYEGELIEATYFSCSGGMTEDAMTVWGADIPYLQSTASPGEEGAAHYTDTVTMTLEEFAACVDTPLSADPGEWFGAVTYTSGGGVETIVIGERTYKGTEVRSMLALRSTDFTIRYTGEAIEIVTHGYGHRVGMSQYGADAMAVAGSSYGDILAHYYQGTALEQYQEIN